MSNKFTNVTVEQLQELVKELDSNEWSIFQKVGQKCTTDEFAEFLSTGEVPAIALADEEMEVLQGGKARKKKSSCACTYQ